ncbi:multidrug ABC transporter ATPase [Mycoavidus cysteinexigens]|uniref:Multidrug ABC transporter ATPase n=1 Tax=Mycoavidus cysteinexigens TaxID=1553431 RepID=A0A2Z6ETL7_9BURK|nr:ABC transporter ATP-binding protein [Mycoavidus cysteinexigens]BBE08722.1 multidrug ABC transporter ATPase [Mycoavidus cysteinexigens]GAM52564.1 ABC transporter ATP-binding protein [bacterium endosymbiont of Mortierella elongata FMR23-6]GLR01416.1 ABC transporter ATP-binding protein [Mycoavidus cysteinexigens]
MLLLPKKLSAFLWHFIRPYRWQFIGGQLCALAWTGDAILWPYLVKLLVDAMENYQPAISSFGSIFLPIFLMLIGGWFLIEGMYRLQGFCFAWLFPRFEAKVRMTVLDYLMQHSHRFFANNLAGSLSNKIADLTQSPIRIFEMVMTMFIPTIVSALVVLVVLALFQPFFVIIFLIWIAIHIGICLYFAGRCNQLSEEHAQARSTLQGRVVDVISNIVSVRIFARQRFEYQHMLPYQQQEQSKQTQSLFYIERMKVALGIAAFICIGIVQMGGIIFAWHRGLLSIGETLLILNATFSIMGMAWMAGAQLPNLFKEIGVCRQALSFIQIEPDVQDAPDAGLLKVTRGEIVFERATFSYYSEHNLFQDKSLVIPAGQKVGLVGLSGSGKTSFVQLILRYYDLDAGRILIDGQDIRYVTQASLHEQISFIPQEPVMFHRNVLENIRYGRPAASDEEVYEAARLAHCEEFIQQLEAGYQTLVGERGTKLSGGQRQRIAIARALLKGAPILILDEATSALDSITEKYVQEGLAKLMPGRTTIVIAHRLSTLVEMDRILVFQKGRIVEDGSHQSLLMNEGCYAELWRRQSGGFVPAE